MVLVQEIPVLEDGEWYCVLEMPIEDNATKMDYLFSCVEKFIEIERERI